jgi:hypothetical protein
MKEFQFESLDCCIAVVAIKRIAVSFTYNSHLSGRMHLIQTIVREQKNVVMYTNISFSQPTVNPLYVTKPLAQVVSHK